MKRAATYLAVAGLLALTWWLYQPGLAGKFLAFDDDHNITVNPHLGCPGWETARWAFTDASYARRYLPLGWLGFSALLAVNGFDARVFHAASLALHLLNGLLLAKILWQLRAPARPAGGLILWAIVAWWWWHPLRVEAVAWVSAFLYVASTTALLAAVVLFLEGLARRPWLRWFSAAAYLVSLLIYPLWLGAPVALAAAGWFRLRATGAGGREAWRPAVVAAVPAGLFAAGVLLVNLVARGAATEEWGAMAASQPGGLLALGPRAGATLGWLGLKIVWPDRLTPADDLWSGGPLALGPLAVGLAVILVVLGVALAVRRRFGPGPLVVLLVFAVVGLPLTGLTEGAYAMSDRYTYPGHLVLAAGLWAAWDRLAPWAARAGTAILLGLTLAGAVRTRGQVTAWGDSDRLMAHLVAAARHDVTRRFYLDWGRCVRACSGRGDEVVRELQAGAAPAPSRRLVLLLQEAGRLGTEAAAWDAGITIESSTHHQFARDAWARGDSRMALAHLARAVELAPRNWPAWSDYAAALGAAGRAGEARAAADRIPATGPAAVCRERALEKLAALGERS